MRKLLIATLLLAALPAVALAVSPPDRSKKQKDQSKRPTANHGTPSLSSGASRQKNQPWWQGATDKAASRVSLVPERPSYGDRRPGGGGLISDDPRHWPDHGQRPGRPNRPDIGVNRPDININRPEVNINRPTINVNRPNININRPVVVNRPNYNQANYNQYNHRPSRAYYSDLHHHWQPNRSVSAWSTGYRPTYSNYNYTGSSGGWITGGMTVSFANPFFVRPIVQQRYAWADYSRPIAIPQPQQQESTADLVNSEQAIRRFDAAREAFRGGDYRRAEALVDEAITLLPGDPTLHEFRALILFTQRRYQEAAATIYSVLAVSPGWDVDTLRQLYADPSFYKRQITDLINFTSANPDAIEAHFLLAYHDVVRQDWADAARQLEVVGRAKPTDRVVLNMIDTVRGQLAQR